MGKRCGKTVNTLEKNEATAAHHTIIYPSVMFCVICMGVCVWGGEVIKTVTFKVSMISSARFLFYSEGLIVLLHGKLQNEETKDLLLKNLLGSRVFVSQTLSGPSSSSSSGATGCCVRTNSSFLSLSAFPNG